jgi:hypothetical protein
MQLRHRSVLVALLLAAALPAAAQQAAARSSELALHAYTLRSRSADEAADLVRGMLSDRGTVTVQTDGRTLLVRDTAESLSRIVPVLRELDRPRQALQLEIMVVRAFRNPVSPPLESTVPAELASKLRRLLSYDVYQLMARADLPTRQEEEVTYEVGAGFTVRFQVGEVAENGQVKLRDFRLYRRGSEEPIIRTHLNLFMDKTYTLGFAKSEDNPTALMLVLTCRDRKAAAKGGG